MSELTHEELIYRLHYDPKTEIFTWRYSASWIVKPGEKAGKIDKTGYLHIKLNQKYYVGHRLAWFYMTGKWPLEQIDHINMDKLDNRWCNLRLASQNKNQWNKPVHKNNTSGEKGVRWDKFNASWRVHVKKNGKQHTSSHRYYWQAVRAARRMREKLHGQYYRHY